MSSAVTVNAANGDKEYHLATAQEGALLSGIERPVPADELALVTTHMGTSMPDRWGYLATASRYQSAVLLENPAPLPATRKVYVQASAGAWIQLFQEVGDRTVGSFSSSWREYEAGRRYAESFNTAVFGPRTGAGHGLFRQGNTIYGDGLRVTDGGGHQGSLIGQTGITTLARLDLALALLGVGQPDEASAVALEAISARMLVASNWWRATEVVRGVERSGIADAADLRDAYETFRPAASIRRL